jgi:hypothetical protein
VTRELVLDLAERVVWTALQGFLGAVSAEALVGGDGDVVRAGLVAAVAAVLSLVKGLVASRVGDGSAATLPGPPS